jgi:(1->4)-alpha-D-glucan 1-alpha-D-glucosylmutase
VPEAAPRPPLSTYRLQLHSGFGFAEAAALAPYLASLGVSHVYLSPVLQAAPGSMHGYDVIDHTRVSADLGGEDALRAAAAAFRAHGLGLIADIVPNHMAIPVPESLNQPLWSVLRDGPGSSFARWFDVDWAARGGRLLLPVLGGPLAACLDDLKLDTAGPEPVLRYFDHVFPVRPGSAGQPLPGLLDAQHYELASWRAAATELNWRRFFDVTTLIAVRVEDPEVFEATHQVLLRLVAEGVVDGLRVDHPDGLADPGGYLERLAARTGGVWVATEKILTGGETLPAGWRCAGTTGYDALRAVGGVFTDPAGAAPLTAAYTRLTGGPAAFAEVAGPAKREEAGQALAAEVARLARLAAAAGLPALAGAPPADLTAVLVELLTAMPVYRAYVSAGQPAPPQSVALVQGAAAVARPHLPARAHPLLDAVTDLALGRGPHASPAFVTLFQQVCGPVMAKGVEDTAFYRWSRLLALNEVGGEPDQFGLDVTGFHSFAARLARDWPASMTTLSTHDTKRQEDVRARLAVLAEIPGAWAGQAAAWHGRAAVLAAGRLPEPDTEYLLWQTLVGAWPIGTERLTGYLRKAMREAKTATSWTDPDEGYEDAVLGLAARVLADAELTRSIGAFTAAIAAGARANSLGAKLVQLAMPGVADVYQGCELAGWSLVDPDNRRPVDFARRRALLAALDAGDPPAGLDEEKLLVTSAALRLRRRHPDWFGGGYTPLAADGPAAGHVLAFARGGPPAGEPGPAVAVATLRPAGLRRRGGWAGTRLPLAPGPWRDLLTGTVHPGPEVALAALTQRLPVALLVPLDADAPPGDDGPGVAP